MSLSRKRKNVQKSFSTCDQTIRQTAAPPHALRFPIKCNHVVRSQTKTTSLRVYGGGTRARGTRIARPEKHLVAFPRRTAAEWIMRRWPILCWRRRDVRGVLHSAAVAPTGPLLPLPCPPSGANTLPNRLQGSEVSRLAADPPASLSAPVLLRRLSGGSRCAPSLPRGPAGAGRRPRPQRMSSAVIIISQNAGRWHFRRLDGIRIAGGLTAARSFPVEALSPAVR